MPAHSIPVPGARPAPRARAASRSRSRAHARALAPLLTAIWLAAACGPKQPTSELQPPDETAAAPSPAPAPAQPEESVAPEVADAGQAGAPHSPAPEATPEPSADPLAPLPEEVRSRFASLPSDPKPEQLIRNSHYWISNESSHYLWLDRVKELGGAFLGVGTDQNYLLAGWAKSELIVVVDFDKAIINLHMAYALLFDKAETPDEFFELWKSEREAEVLGWIEERYADHPDYEQIRKAFKVARQIVYARLRRTRKQYEERGTPTFITDQAQYDHVRTLWQNGRVFAVRGDFTKDETMVALAKALDESKMTLKVIYLSNVEQYFDFTPEYRRNMINLPIDADSVVVRTLGWRGFGLIPGETYHYNLQPARLFAGWLEKSRVTNLPRMMYYTTKTKTHGYSILERDPLVSKRPPEIAE